MNLEETLIQMLQEADVDVQQTLDIDIDTVIRLALERIASEANVHITNYNLRGDFLTITIPDDAQHKVAILRDMLNIEGNDGDELTDDKMNSIKVYVDSLVTKALGSDHSIKFNSIDDKYGDIVYIHFDIEDPAIDAEIEVTYKLYDEGFTSLSYTICGDRELKEYWSTSNCKPEDLIAVLESVKEYYSSK